MWEGCLHTGHKQNHACRACVLTSSLPSSAVLLIIMYASGVPSTWHAQPITPLLTGCCQRKP